MATPIVVTIPHKIGKAEARSRLADGFSRVAEKASGGAIGQVRQAWDGDRLNVQARGLGQTLNARIDVRDRDVRIEIDLPAFLAGFADLIAGKLKREGAVLLEDKRKR